MVKHGARCTKALGLPDQRTTYKVKYLISSATHDKLCVCRHPKRNVHGVIENMLAICRKKKYNQLIQFCIEFDERTSDYEKHVQRFDHLMSSSSG